MEKVNMYYNDGTSEVVTLKNGGFTSELRQLWDENVAFARDGLHNLDDFKFNGYWVYDSDKINQLSTINFVNEILHGHIGVSLEMYVNGTIPDEDGNVISNHIIINNKQTHINNFININTWHLLTPKIINGVMEIAAGEIYVGYTNWGYIPNEFTGMKEWVEFLNIEHL